MKRWIVLTLTPCILFGLAPVLAQDEPLEEEVKVTLALVEALVLDKQGNTVPGLTKEDFRLSVQGRAREIDTFDASCPADPVSDPLALGPGDVRGAGPLPPQKRRIALVLDYYHTPLSERHWAMQQAKAMVAGGMGENDEIMVVALANGVRVEQRFTGDPREALQSLVRMEHDASLWARTFEPLTERSFFDNLGVVMDVLSFTEGPKAVVLYSGFYGRSDTMDLWYQQVAASAAAARTAIYPVDIWGLQARGPVGGSHALARLASESGGRLTERTTDLSLGFARAQRDLACRYTLGFYVEPDEGRKRRQVRVSANRKGVRVRAPEWMRVPDEKSRRARILRAAYADPDLFDSPLIRLTSVPLAPVSGKSWNAVTLLNFPIPNEPQAVAVDVGATLTRDGTTVRTFGSTFEVEPRAGLPGDDRPVTIFSEGGIKPGMYTLTVVLSRAGDTERVYTSGAEITIPEVPAEGLFVHGPVLARTLGEGVLLRATKKGLEEVERSDRMREIVGPDGSFEPLIVHQIGTEDTLLAAWSICTVDGKWSAPPEATIERTVIGRDGSGEAHRLDPLALDLPAKGKARCQSYVDSVPQGTLDPRLYDFNVRVVDAEGGMVTRGLGLFLVE
jgi:VWFA-related protein